MFIGEFEHSLDSKARLIVPAKFRDGLGDRFVFTRGLDACIFGYPMSEWANIEAKMRALSLTQSDARAFARMFFSGACECEVDKQGRVVVPPSLRGHALIERDVVVIGVLARIEIWAKETWAAYSSRVSPDYESFAENIHELGSVGL